MNSSDTRVATYLDDLARMLADLDPGERDDVLAGIREHLDASLAEHPDDPAAVDAALRRLGPPERVAAEARVDRAPTGPAAAPPRRTQGWGRVAVIASMVSILPVLLVPTAQRLVSLATGFGSLGVWPIGIELVTLLAPVWLLSVVALLLADGLPNATRRRLATLGPLAVIGSVPTSVWWSPEALSSVVTVALLGTLAVVTVRAGLRGWRESSA